MPDTHQISVTLPDDMAAAVARKVESGEYASASEVLLDGVRSLMERDEGLEHWLRTEVVAAHAEYLADPTNVIPIEEIEDWVNARLAQPPE